MFFVSVLIQCLIRFHTGEMGLLKWFRALIACRTGTSSIAVYCISLIRYTRVGIQRG
jgi:hypothetical protein